MTIRTKEGARIEKVEKKKEQEGWKRHGDKRQAKTYWERMRRK